MRYVEGRDLKERCNAAVWTRRTRSTFVAQVASALDAAHARGLVHRDVKPSNVLLDVGPPNGSDHVYLADFGLTRRSPRRSESATTATSWAPSTTSRPSRSRGGVDGRADVYSLGCVLYECLVGQPPFRRDSDLAVVFAHLETESPDRRAPGGRSCLPRSTP